MGNITLYRIKCQLNKLQAFSSGSWFLLLYTNCGINLSDYSLRKSILLFISHKKTLKLQKWEGGDNNTSLLMYLSLYKKPGLVSNPHS